MKKLFIGSLAFFATCIISLILFAYFKPITILENVKIYRHLDRLHYIYYKDMNIGWVSQLDSWYVQDGKVYGSISDMNADYDKTNGFYIDTCSSEVYISAYHKDFEEFLDKRNISKEKRDYMSGNNIVEPYQDRHTYDKNYQCPKNQ